LRQEKLIKESLLVDPKTSDYKGKVITELDFSGADYFKALSLIGIFKEYISSHPKKSLLILTDMTGVKVNSRVIDAFKDFTAFNKQYVLASAVIGLAGPYKIFLNTVNYFTKRDIKLFSDAASAKEWLTSHV
jgi:hypothetical protein